MLSVVAGSIAAQQAPQDQPPACANPAAAIGVSRVVEVDATGGPLLGNQQYPDHDFLKDGEIVLTFDDGPLRPHTQPVLNALDAHCTKATFFTVGRMALADPAMLREVARRGHTIGTHTWSHRNLAGSSLAKAKEEIELGISAVTKALGAPIAPFFRFPYLADSRAVIGYLGQRNIAVFSIDADSKDYRTKSPEPVRRLILSQLEHQRKGILLFHDIQRSTAAAIGDLLTELKRRGFKVVHLVPKSTVTTVAEYDALADKEIARRKLALAAQPLASRSIVWPMSGQGGAPDVVDKSTPPAVHKVRASAPRDPAGAAPQDSNTAPEAHTAAQKPGKHFRRENEDWWKKQFFD